MKREQLSRLVGEDLDHIAEGTKGSVQRELRMLFNTRRRRDLGRDSTTPRGQTLRYAIDFLKKDCPDFDPEYDKHYFALD